MLNPSMIFFRPTLSSRPAVGLPRPVLACIRPTLPLAANHTRPYAHSGYGDGKGDPVAENPQEQPPTKSRDLEHPGPPPPDVGKGGDAPARKVGGRSDGEQKHSKNQATRDGGQTAKGAQPKILNENPPSERDPEVRQHNDEMKQRTERADMKVSNEDAYKDKVSSGFRSVPGQGRAKAR